LIEIEKGIEFGQKIIRGTILIELYSRKAHICILMGEIEDAEESLELADKVRRDLVSRDKKTVPWQVIDFYRSRFELHLYRLRESIEKDGKGGAYRFRRNALKSGKRLMRTARRVAQNRTDAYRLMGVYCWLVNHQKKALKWWQRAIEQGERLDARLDLLRTYFQVGKCLLRPDSKYHCVAGLKPEESLEKAKGLIEEMDLEWDLEELERVITC
jgi:tetratricopeptide (TPR) repeat protein